MELGGVTFARAHEHVVERRLASAHTAPDVEAIAVTEPPSRRVAGREVQMPRRDDHPLMQLYAAGRSDEGDAAGRVDERSACRDRRRDAKQRGIRERNLELRLGSRRADHADVLESSVRSLHHYGFRGRELAGLGQRARDVEWCARQTAFARPPRRGGRDGSKRRHGRRSLAHSPAAAALGGVRALA